MSQWVLITGAAGGIGYASCQLFKERGWKVIGLDVKAITQAPAVDRGFQVDLTDLAAMRTMAQALNDEGILLTSLVNNAAFQKERSFMETSEQEWDRILDTNLKGPFFLSQILLPMMVPNASIVHVSSVHARCTSKGLSAYAAAKGGLVALTRSMALECGSQGIRVNAVLPGAIDTPMLDQGLSRAPDAAQARQRLKEASPLGRLGMGRDVAELIYFLSCHQSAANITGQEFVCDSGVLARLASE